MEGAASIDRWPFRSCIGRSAGCCSWSGSSLSETRTSPSTSSCCATRWRSSDATSATRRSNRRIERCWPDWHDCSPAGVSGTSSSNRQPCCAGTGPLSRSAGPIPTADPVDLPSPREPPQWCSASPRRTRTGATAASTVSLSPSALLSPLERLDDPQALWRRAFTAQVGADLGGVPHCAGQRVDGVRLATSTRCYCAGSTSSCSSITTRVPCGSPG